MKIVETDAFNWIGPVGSQNSSVSNGLHEEQSLAAELGIHVERIKETVEGERRSE